MRQPTKNIKEKNMVDQGQRIDLLEEGQYFQEKNLKELHDALTFQQKQIDMLEKKLHNLEAKITSVLQVVDGQGIVQTLPPHSVAEKY